MAGPVSTTNSPLNVQPQTGSSLVDDTGQMTGQIRQQTQQFGTMLKDPGFNGQSEMGAMLKLQREVAQEQMMFQSVSNVLKARTDSSKNAISNMK